MENKPGVSRRNFIRQSSLGLGAGIAGISASACITGIADGVKKPPREICVATIDLKEFRPVQTMEARIKTVLRRMHEVAAMKPDLVCLPELFASIWVAEKIPIDDIAVDEQAPGGVASQISGFAKVNSCYVVCPVYTKKDGHYYNSAILFDRKGDIAGIYHKIHPSKSEMVSAVSATKNVIITPGALEHPVIETDFGKVAMRINEDVHWVDSWNNLKKQGAEVILYLSALTAGRMLNYYAWSTNCYIVSSASEGASVVDMSGNVLDSSSLFVRYAWARINLDKVNVDTWPTNERIPRIYRKFGDKVGIKVWGSTEVVTIESRSPDVDVKEVLKEFKLQTIDEVVETSRIVQDQLRP